MATPSSGPATSDPAVTASLAATVASSVMITQQVASRATRDALFLSSFPARLLPPMVLASAVLSLLGVFAATRATARYGPARVAPAAFGLNALLFGGDWVLAHLAPGPAAILLYLHIALFGATVISLFWTLISERFDPHTCKKVIGRVVAGGTAGGIVGGLVAWNTGVLLSVRSNLALMALMNLLCALGAIRVGVRQRAQSMVPEVKEAEPTLAVLRGSNYVQLLAAAVALVAIGEALIEYVFNSSAAAAHHDGRSLLRFFAIFHTGTGLAAFMLQTALARRTLARIGPGGTIALLPVTMLIGAATAFRVPALWSSVVLRGGEATLANSLYRSGYELFYAPIPPEHKRATKTIVDVGLDRVGQAIGGALTMLALLAAPTTSRQLLLSMIVAIALGLLLVSRVLTRGYVAALAASLKAAEEETQEDARPDPKLTAVPSPPARPVSDERWGAESAALVRDAEALSSGDVARALSVLQRREPADVRLGAHAVPLLAVDELAPTVIGFLRAIGDRITGGLIDALLDPTAPLHVRRRIPLVLRGCPSQRGADGLLLGLDDESFEVRYQCGLALLRIVEKVPTITVPEGPVIGAVLREVARDKATWESRLELESRAEDDDEFVYMDAYLRLRTSRGLQFVFALLAACGEREPMMMAFRALSTDDDDMRGTALEYLENVLPDDVREALWPFLGEQRAFHTGARRERTTVAKQLLASSEAIASLLERMRKGESVVPTSGGSDRAPSSVGPG